MEQTLLLGLDLASRVTGWCCGSGQGAPLAGVWEFPSVGTVEEGADYGLLLGTLRDYLDIAFARFPGITHVAYESPILISQANRHREHADKLSTLRLLYPLGAMVELYARDWDRECREFGVAEAKREVTGNSYAEKEDVARMAEACGVVLPVAGRHDAGDAWSVWKCLLRDTDPQTNALWDTKIRQNMGGLL